jgi:predicted RNase H-like HicB family nuclease
MEAKKYVYWEDQGMWIGYLEEYPDYMSQGESLDELKENLKDIYHDWYQNPNTKISQPIPRHREINENLSKHIIKLLSKKEV